MSEKKTAVRLADLDLTTRLDEQDYEARLGDAQTCFQQIQQAYLKTGDEAVVVFEGWDAAGKGGAIRRMASVMDPRGFRVWPIGAPKGRDAERHYMARFWDRLPAKGEIGVFDRSWYGRVLVERVEGFAAEPEWERAYEEINAFEKQLVDAGTRIAKVFLYIDRAEQLKRFEKRLHDPLKRWKLSFEDFRNRDKWDDYERAADEMLARTDTAWAPWHVIPANHKKYARVAALEGVASRLAAGVDLSPPPLDPELEARFRKEVKEAKG
ncbi:MAG: polyphosphate kinase [Aurantimonas endophytica]|uniref:Polyphosphate kinase 2 (PPK2 family) n=1 Tax=Aurantimonas endophytica TaxID=1522175 RepID=A0A7W6MQX4_9HYPH|nr:polyphosphate kinase [Aurantimonas endophytica]MBB4004485.1 polyphosphate kinase 2 (PPK2 family) [Aurantimonas endophytica]MCO6405321.1 polyphosphate kinase [Aurantimonas endophytica]